MPTPTDDAPFTKVTFPLPLGAGDVDVKVSLEDTFAFSNNKDGGVERTICWQVPCPHEADFCDWLLGVASYAMPGSGTFSFPLPQIYPNGPNLRCSELQLVRFTGAKKPGRHGVTSNRDAVIQARYTTPYFDITGDSYKDLFDGLSVPWTKVSSTESYEEYAINGDGLVTGTGDPFDRKLKRRVAITDYLIERRMISELLVFRNILRSLKNTLNDDTFMGAERGTLYFDGFGWNPTRDGSGNPVQDFRVSIREREADWNSEPAEDVLSGWVDVKDSADPPNRNYVYADWTPIYRYGIVA